MMYIKRTSKDVYLCHGITTYACTLLCGDLITCNWTDEMLPRLLGVGGSMFNI